MTQSESTRQSFGTKLRNQISSVSDKASRAWNTIRQTVIRLAENSLQEIIFFFEPDTANPNEGAQMHRIRTVEAIINCLGEDPAGALVAMSPREREIALAQLHAEISNALGIEPSLVSSQNIDGYAGLYSFSEKMILLNELHIQKQPMTLIDAKQLIGTVCHETYHAFQRQAVIHPSRYGISKAEAKIWKINFANYITPEQNPERYMYQPVELTAYVFESAIINCIYKED